VPIGVFIGGLAASQRLLRGRIEGRALILVSFVLAVSLTLLVICVIPLGINMMKTVKKGDFHG
jgi:hypothetical protein